MLSASRPFLLALFVALTTLSACATVSSQSQTEPPPDATLSLLTMRAPNMTCAGCVGAVQGALSNLQGVYEVRIDLSTKEVRVTFDPLQITSNDIIANDVFDTYGREFISDEPLP